MLLARNVPCTRPGFQDGNGIKICQTDDWAILKVFDYVVFRYWKKGSHQAPLDPQVSCRVFDINPNTCQQLRSHVCIASMTRAN